MPSGLLPWKFFQWLNRGLTGSNVPIIQSRAWSDAASADAVSVIAATWTPVYKQSSRVNAGDIITWVPASTKRSRVLLFTISGTAGANVAFRFNSDDPIDATPTWVTRFEFRIPADGTVAIPLPDHSQGPAGDGTNATAKLEVISGTGTFYGTMLGYEL